jgi:hypothetical protein
MVVYQNTSQSIDCDIRPCILWFYQFASAEQDPDYIRIAIPVDLPETDVEEVQYQAAALSRNY